MSERGSFTTEYIYCPECFLAAKKALNNGNFQAIEHDIVPIVCGKAGGMWKNEDALFVSMVVNMIGFIFRNQIDAVLRLMLKRWL